ncbi:hypothetical protein [Micromonospora luteifusca]|uniref:hypothetical protein n=1 Tax=Micromonospora luteifusca TaxID=709860 RepID=UPI0033B204DE
MRQSEAGHFLEAPSVVLLRAFAEVRGDWSAYEDVRWPACGVVVAIMAGRRRIVTVGGRREFQGSPLGSWPVVVGRTPRTLLPAPRGAGGTRRGDPELAVVHRLG